MDKEFEYRGESPDPEMVFRAVRRSILDEYERELDELQANWEAQQAVGQRVRTQTRQILERSNLDLAGAEALAKAEQEEMQQHLDRVRAQYVDRAPQRAERLREETERVLGHLQTGWSAAQLIGADVVAATPEQLEGYEGEVGNPAKWIYEANKSMKAKAWTVGKAGCVGGWQYCPTGTIWYYAWPATGLGKCTVQVWLGYHGFRNLYAVPVPFDFCAYAGAIATAKLQIYQQVGYPPKYSKFLGYDEKKVIDFYGYGLVSAGVVDGTARLSTDVNIQSLNQVYISVSLVLQVAARGQVSYAELNFQDGAANYVSPPFVAITY